MVLVVFLKVVAAVISFTVLLLSFGLLLWLILLFDFLTMGATNDPVLRVAIR